ncbi:hypothetical protein GUJ93_ZPchr0012g18861 [Zizania palustris]|uniref:Uncharacterized protein n=1 Tax=Zizania palustris TaxID=103762 RepID=A0A8J5WPE8_ZIZPA|nr:hypothetical protein GUJ93_ZPchr0012g18861 [Zizania palustris]
MTHAGGLLRDPRRRPPPRPTPSDSAAPLHAGLHRSPPRRAPPRLLPATLSDSASPLPTGLRHASSPRHRRTPPLPSPQGSTAPPPCHTVRLCRSAAPPTGLRRASSPPASAAAPLHLSTSPDTALLLPTPATDLVICFPSQLGMLLVCV